MLASAKIPKFAWAPGEEFEADLWLLNDGQLPICAGAVNVSIVYGGETHFLLRWDHDGAAANENLAGPTVRHILNNWRCDVQASKFTELRLIIEAGDMSSEYILIIY
jgi:hypothetical protein